MAIRHLNRRSSRNAVQRGRRPSFARHHFAQTRTRSSRYSGTELLKGGTEWPVFVIQRHPPERDGEPSP